ncbi:MAG: hypothetical protein ACTSXF_08805, partial [Promethearchaeota archaeon]
MKSHHIIDQTKVLKKNKRVERLFLSLFFILLFGSFLSLIFLNTNQSILANKQAGNSTDVSNENGIINLPKASISPSKLELITELGWGNSSNSASANDVCISSDHSVFYAVGLNEGNSTNNDVFVAKYWLNGSQIWNTTWQGPNEDKAESCILSKNESILYVVGSTKSYTAGDWDVILFAINASNGMILYNTSWGGSDGDQGKGIDISEDGLYLYIGGNTISYGTSGTSDFLLLKVYSVNGTLVWNKTCGNAVGEIAYSVKVSDSGNAIYLAGSMDLGGGHTTWALARFNSTGSLIWWTTTNNNGYSEATDLVLAENNTSLYAVGYAQLATDDTAIQLCEFYSNGTLRWTKEWNASAGEDRGFGIVMAPDNNSLYVSGYTSIDSLTSAQVIIKFSLNGTQLWNHTLNYQSNIFSVFNSLAITDDGGILVLAGFDWILFGNSNATIKIFNTHLVPASPELRISENPSYDGSFSVMWNNISNADNYTLYWNDTSPINDSNIAFQSNVMYGLVNESIDVSGLSPGHRYYGITAVSKDGNSSINCVEARVHTSPQPMLIDVESHPTETGSVFLRWNYQAAYPNVYIFRDTSKITDVSSLQPIAFVTNRNNYTEANVPTGTWWYAIIANNNTPANTTLSNSKSTNVQHKPSATVLQDPINDPQNRTLTLTWSAVPQATLYYVYASRSPIISTYDDTPLVITSSTSAVLLNTSTGLWHYAIACYNDTGLSVLSNMKSITIQHTPLPPVLEPLPSVSANRTVQLNWSDVDGATTYYVYRSPNEINDSNVGSLTPIISVSQSEFTDVNVPLGVQHYAIVANNATGNSTVSNDESTDVQDIPQAPIISPIPDLVWDNTSLYINWTSVSGASGYLLYYSHSEINNSNIDSATLLYNSTGTSYVHSNLIPGNYHYIVIAYNSTGNSSLSSDEFAELRHHPPAPSLSSLPASTTGEAGSVNINISWTPNDLGNCFYRIYRHTSDFNNSTLNPSYFIGQTAVGVNSWIDHNVPVGTFYYAVSAVNSSGEGNVSSTVFTTVSHTPVHPAINSPSSPILFGQYVHLTWSASPGATQYYVFRSNSEINDTNIGSLTPIGTNTTENYYDLPPSLGIWYYAVIANNGTGNSSVSNCVYVSVEQIPAAPVLSQPQSPIASFSIFLNWSNVDGATGYYIFRNNAPINDTNVASLTPINNTSSTNYTDTVSAIGTYYYAIMAYNSSGNSSVSNNVSVSVVTPIGNVILNQITPYPSITGNITLNWSAASNTEFYYVFMKHNSPFSSTDGLNYVINTTQTSCNITGLALGIWYFRVL